MTIFRKDVDVLFLYDHTGLAAEPFTKLGYKTMIVDLLNNQQNDRVTYTEQMDILDREDYLKEIARTAKLIIGFPPCTDLAVSGACRFKKKRENNPNFQEEALYMFKSVYRIAHDTGNPYAAENPVSVISTMYRKPDFKFDPYEYSGYLPDDDIHPMFPTKIPQQDRYTKKTCLWTGNNFKMPEKLPATKPLINWHNKTSGKDKIARSASPRGFFIALANSYDKEWKK